MCVRLEQVLHKSVAKAYRDKLIAKYAFWSPNVKENPIYLEAYLYIQLKLNQKNLMYVNVCMSNRVIMIHMFSP